MEENFTLIPAHPASIKPPTLIRRIQMELGALIAHDQMEDLKQGKSVVREGPEPFSLCLVFLSQTISLLSVLRQLKRKFYADIAHCNALLSSAGKGEYAPIQVTSRLLQFHLFKVTKQYRIFGLLYLIHSICIINHAQQDIMKSQSSMSLYIFAQCFTRYHHHGCLYCR